MRIYVQTYYRLSTTFSAPVVDAHVNESVALAATVIREGVKHGTFRTVDLVAAVRGVLFGTSCFHHPAHASKWADPGIDATYNDVW
jgi:hypothetical protein